LHANPKNAGAFFQVASQFNLLEMTDPSRTPEDGIGCYQFDHTQGPACAMAAGAGTILRNYLVPLGDGVGQSAQNQLDCLESLGKHLGNHDGLLWKMRNGYALASEEGLEWIARRLHRISEKARDELRGKLQIGIHWETQVTLAGCDHRVTQAYCSALPVAYSRIPAAAWKPFAQLVLEAAYEASLAAAVLNASRTGNRQVFLTLLGGGAFGNDTGWIVQAIQRAMALHESHDLDLRIVSYGASNPSLRPLLSNRR